MSQCLEGVKQLFASLLPCCDLEAYKQTTALEDPEILARETVCMLLLSNTLSIVYPFDFKIITLTTANHFMLKVYCFFCMLAFANDFRLAKLSF